MREAKNASFEKLYAEYYSYVLRYIGRRISDQAIIEDLAQDVFLSAYRGYPEFDERKAKFSTWLFVIVNNRLKNYFRSYKKPISLIDIDDIAVLSAAPDMEQAVFIEECRRAITAGLEKLSDKSRQVIIMKYFQNMTGAQIASVLGMSEVNVRVTTYRALEKLQQVLDPNILGD